MTQQIQDLINLLHKNKLPAALQKSINLISEQPNNPELHHLQGITYAKLHDMPQAIQAFTHALELDPSQAVYHNNLSNAYKIQGNLELAIRHLHQALFLAPNNAEAHNNLGSLYYTQGQINQAIPMFEKAIRLNPNSWEAHYNLANCYIKQEMVLQAISHYETVLSLNPQHGNAKLNLAMALVSMHNYTAALPFLIEAASNNPEHAELQGHLAEAYLDLGKSSEAIQQYTKALMLEPSRAEWQHNLAVLYLRNKQPDLARKHFAASLEINPDNSTAQHMLQALDAQHSAESSTAPAEYVSELFDQYASYYNQHVSNQLNYKVPQLLRQAMSKYITHATKQQNVLDLGCGTGMCGVYFRDLAGFLIGVDLSAAMLHQAKVLGAYDGLCRCNILEVIPGYKRAVFDLVLAADVLVYIGDLEPIFNIVSGALRANGKFAFTVESLENSEQNYQLQTSGRFAHNQEYILSLCNKFEFTIGTQDKIVLREQDGEPIIGWLYIMQLATY